MRIPDDEDRSLSCIFLLFTGRRQASRDKASLFALATISVIMQERVMYVVVCVAGLPKEIQHFVTGRGLAVNISRLKARDP